MNTVAGQSDYRRGGLERLQESWILLRQGLWAGAVYLAGRAVESMLRAVIWKNDPDIRSGRKSLETGHDLRQMLAMVRDLGVLREDEHRNKLAENVQHVGRLWFNNLRFPPMKKLETLWWDLGEVHRKRTLKKATDEFYDACSMIVKRCEALCRS